jgi:hypothetical protein
LKASNIKTPTNVDDLIANFKPTKRGTYYIRVTGTLGTDYSLVVTRNADFSIEDNNSFDTVQTIGSAQESGKQWVLGAISSNTITLKATDSGWWDNTGFHNQFNDSYFAGFVPTALDNLEFRNFFTFNIPTLQWNPR